MTSTYSSPKAKSTVQSAMSPSQENPMFEAEEIVEKYDVDDDEFDPKETLSAVFPKSFSYYMIGGVIINVGMLLFSHLGLSAVVNSSICPDGFKGCPDSIDASDLVGACSSNPSDAAILVPGNPAFEDVPEYMSVIGVDCLGADQCILNGVMEETGLSEDCAACFVLNSDCSVEHCLGPCLINPLSQRCFKCNEDFCSELFENCTGVDFPSNVIGGGGRFALEDSGLETSDRELQREPQPEPEITECFDRDEFELFKVFNLTFVNSIQEAFKGGSAALAILIILASGVWPYTKNILMLYAWFKPMSQKKRDSILRILGIFGKWSLVDVFAVVLIINGVVIQKILIGDSPLIVFAESRAGIYMFGIAAVWALCQGELVRYLEKIRLKQRRTDAEEKWRDPVAGEETLLLRYRVVMGVCALVSFIFTLTGLLNLNLGFVISGTINDFPGPDRFNYTVFEMGTGLTDECALYDGHGSKAGAYFLAFVFIVLVAIIPLITCALMVVVGVTFHHSKAENWLVGFTFGLGNFAAVDVFFLSLVTLASQFEGLIEAAVGEGVDEQCGVTEADKENGEFCINFKGSIETGAWLLLFASVFFWVSQIAAGKLIQHTYKLVGPLKE